jgi:hypothetical protein
MRLVSFAPLVAYVSCMNGEMNGFMFIGLDGFGSFYLEQHLGMYPLLESENNSKTACRI